MAEHTGSFYGLPMTAGDIYTVAGNGDQEYSGGTGQAYRGRPAPARGRGGRQRGQPVDRRRGNNRIREVTG